MLFIPVYLTHRKLNLVPSQPEWVSWYLKLLPHGFSPVVARDRASAHLSYRQVVLTIRSPSGTAKKKKPFLPGSLSSQQPQSLNSCCFYIKAQSPFCYDGVATEPVGYSLLPTFFSANNANYFEVFSKIHQGISG